MSWLGVKYALACRDERVKLGARLVLIALGVRVEYRRITTSPTSLGELKWMTFMSVEQIRRVLDDLEEWGKVSRVRRGKNAIYGLPDMAGPLFAIDHGDPVKMTDFVIEGLPKEIGQDARKVTGRVTGSRRRMTDFAGRRAGGVLFSEEVRTKDVPTTAEGDAAVGAFLGWFVAEYRRHRGVLYRPANPVKAEALVRELLAAYGDATLRQMALAMWADTKEPWLNDTRKPNDRSVFSLHQKATYLEGVVRAVDSTPPAAQPWHWALCPHEPKCMTHPSCRDRQRDEQPRKAAR